MSEPLKEFEASDSETCKNSIGGFFLRTIGGGVLTSAMYAGTRCLLDGTVHLHDASAVAIATSFFIAGLSLFSRGDSPDVPSVGERLIQEAPRFVKNAVYTTIISGVAAGVSAGADIATSQSVSPTRTLLAAATAAAVYGGAKLVGSICQNRRPSGPKPGLG